MVKRLDRLGINCAHAKCRRIWERTQVEQIGPKDTKGSILTWGYVGASFGGLGGLIFHQKSGECHEIQGQQIKINFLKIKCTNIYNFATTIPGKAG